MATLEDRGGKYRLGITPVAPSLGGPQDAYDVRVRQGDALLFQRQYTIYGETPDGHWYVWRLFRALQLGERLSRAKTTFNVTGHRAKHFNEDATINVNTGWLDLILSGDTITHTHGRPEPWVEARCGVKVYLLNRRQTPEPALSLYRQFTLVCRPADVVRFGQELEEECRESLRLRRELGITAPADDYIDD